MLRTPTRALAGREGTRVQIVGNRRRTLRKRRPRKPDRAGVYHLKRRALPFKTMRVLSSFHATTPDIAIQEFDERSRGIDPTAIHDVAMRGNGHRTRFEVAEEDRLP